MTRPSTLRFFCILPILLAFLPSCVHHGSHDSADAQFQKLTDQFLESHYAFRPIAGAGLGWHQYDGKFVLPDAAALAAERARLQRFEAAFAAIPVDALTPAHRHDLRLLQSAIS